MESLRKHKHAFLVSAAINIGAILFGFDTGIAGGVVSLGSFKDEFGLLTSKSESANATSNVVALLDLGAFLGALAPPLLSRYVGRRALLAGAALFFLIGGILQVAASGPGLAMVYGGRVVAGVGVGVISTIAPIYVAECSPKHLRGMMMSMFELFLVSGGMLAYWVTYGCSLHLPATKIQWRTPLSLQIILAVIVFASALVIPESPRWLAKQNRFVEAKANLCYLRAAQSDSEDIIEEVAEIRAQIEQELVLTKGRTLNELFERHNFVRVLWALMMGLGQMWCGHIAILYYGPAVFAQIGYTTQNAGLLASGVFTCVKFVSQLVFMAGGVQYLSRKTLLTGGAFFMGVFMFVLGGVLATHPPSDPGNGAGSPSAQGMMALIYLFVVAYSLTWGPVPWIYMGEIFPTRIRDHGMALATANIWIWNFVVAKITPISIVNIGWKTWMVFGSFDTAAAVLMLILPETKDLSLEEMDILFGLVDASTRRTAIQEKVDADHERRAQIVIGERGGGGEDKS